MEQQIESPSGCLDFCIKPSKVNRQKSTLKGQQSKVNSQRSIVKGQKSTVKGQPSKVKSQPSKVNSQNEKLQDMGYLHRWNEICEKNLPSHKTTTQGRDIGVKLTNQTSSHIDSQQHIRRICEDIIQRLQ